MQIFIFFSYFTTPSQLPPEKVDYLKRKAEEPEAKTKAEDETKAEVESEIKPEARKQT